MKVAVIGANGRMGKSVCKAINETTDLELVAQLDAGDEICTENLHGAQVAVEFTIPSAAKENVKALIAAGVHVVVGTTGWNESALQEIEELSEKSGKNVLIAPNYSISAILAMNFAKQAAKYFESVEIIELHHPDKVDAPSGTAIATAQGVIAARKAAGNPPIPDATETDADGARGANIAGVHIHAVRLRGLYAHEEILLGNAGEQLTIRQDSFDRQSFMPGVILGVRQIINHPGLTYGLDKFLEL